MNNPTKANMAEKMGGGNTKKAKKPIPEKYAKAIAESRAYMDKRKELKNEMNGILRSARQ